MGTFNVTFGTTAQQATRSRAIADAAFAARIVPAFKFEYGANKDTGSFNPDGSPVVTPKTNAELMDDFFNQLERYLLNVVRRYEKDQAVQSVPTVSDLPLT